MYYEIIGRSEDGYEKVVGEATTFEYATIMATGLELQYKDQPGYPTFFLVRDKDAA